MATWPPGLCAPPIYYDDEFDDTEQCYDLHGHLALPLWTYACELV